MFEESFGMKISISFRKIQKYADIRISIVWVCVCVYCVCVLALQGLKKDGEKAPRTGKEAINQGELRKIVWYLFELKLRKIDTLYYSTPPIFGRASGVFWKSPFIEGIFVGIAKCDDGMFGWKPFMFIRWLTSWGWDEAIFKTEVA